jgi:hypothetical protein
MQIAKSQVMDTYANNFTGAVAYLAWKVAEIFPEAFNLDMCRDNRRKGTVAEMRSEQGRGRRGAKNRAQIGTGGRYGQTQHGRGSAQGFRRQGRSGWPNGTNDHCCGRGYPFLINGVDVSDPRRNFGNIEFQQLGPS